MLLKFTHELQYTAARCPNQNFRKKTSVHSPVVNKGIELGGNRKFDLGFSSNSCSALSITLLKVYSEKRRLF